MRICPFSQPHRIKTGCLLGVGEQRERALPCVGFLFCFVLFSLQLSVCLWWHDYRRDVFPTLKFGVVMADLLAIC